MNVLSLFDGISCGKLALERAGFTNFTYYASEIDKNAIKCSQDNHKDIIRLGDVTKVSYSNGVLHSENGAFNVGKIDLLIGGSPCQSFSAANIPFGKQTGLQGKSGLFYQFLRILNEIKAENPSVNFLLENVRMSKDSKSSLDNYLGVSGQYFNSELVSFQKRPRYYWCSWAWELPHDKQVSFQTYKQQGDLSNFMLKEVPSHFEMWNNGKGRNGGLKACPNVTHAEKIHCVTTRQDRAPNSGLIEYNGYCRQLTQHELELAQTLPVNYTKVLSYRQAQAVIGNGWTVDAVAHIFSHLKIEIQQTKAA